MIPLRHNPAKARLVHLFSRGVRALAVGILALAVLTPLLQGFSILAQTGSSSCRMTCCKAGAARCQRTGRGDSSPGPRWTSQTQCPSGCGQLARSAGSAVFQVAADEFCIGAIQPETTLTSSSPVHRAFSCPEFRLFQRPPPFAA